MPIFSARNGHETKLLIYFQERKIREKLLLNEGTMMKVFRVIRSWCRKVFRKIKRWMMKPFRKKAKTEPEEKDMAFFNSAAKARGIKFGRRPSPLPLNFNEFYQRWKMGKYL